MNLKKALGSLLVILSTFNSMSVNANLICKSGEFCTQDIRCRNIYTHKGIVEANAREGLRSIAERAQMEDRLLMNLEQAIDCIDAVCKKENTILIMASGRIRLENCFKSFLTFWIEEAVGDDEYFTTGHKLGGVYPRR